MGISNGRDVLSRVAFETSDGTLYKFAINPQSMAEQYNARNTFMQTQNLIQMQGYGQGMHTITISGVTGVNKGKGFDRLKELKDLIVKQINTAHDTDDSTANSIIFHNFTNNESWVVELNQDGIKIEQSSRDPLSYTYNISMVVIKSASTPDTQDVSWIQLGNIAPSLESKRVQTNLDYKYGKTALKDFNYNGYATSLSQFKASRQGTISNYGQDGMYQEQKQLDKSQIASLYKVVYGKVLPDFDWSKYIDASGYFSGRKQGTVNDYGQTNAGDAVKILPPYEVQKIYQSLYGNTLNAIDYGSFDNMATMFTAMKRGTIYDYGTGSGADTSDDSLTVEDALSMYSIIYGRTVKSTDYNSYANASGLFASAKKESINNYGQGTINDAMFNTLSSIKERNVLNYSDTINPWERLSESEQSRYSNEGASNYLNPIVSNDATAYTYFTINNELKV